MQQLRGLNLGGWLMMEGYILGGRNIPEHLFKRELAKLYGPDFVVEFTKRFRESFITDQDFARIKKLGLNCVRLPFNYRLLEEHHGFEYLQNVVGRIGEAGLQVILDMHAVPGSQNTDWHSDSEGQALFWENSADREKYFALWQKLAQTFKNEVALAGYDVMNEPVTKDVKLLTEVFQQVVEIIRGEGGRQTIFLEGDEWGTNIEFIKDIKGDNLAISIHFYQPFNFVFNWLPADKYPDEYWHKEKLRSMLKNYADFARQLKLPVLVGEFGVVSRCPCCGAEFQWVKDVLDIFQEFGWSWTYWTYKSIQGMKFPDGLYQLSDTTGIIGTPAHETGLDNFYQLLKDRREEFFRVWKTDNFKLNDKLVEILKVNY
ncbi:hypothetical protein COT42_07375 [Candidatus Saganbacteria bacterium CG08_land_8_20_14_0_20_45_16]|uniref:Glycoside hydrolase family 5 domain-containing protein n=1 Tax=Candidatus Saganbacteria bacterium CG08_land_8_20_14_0_20_45_16 TaxID=2014293 RepID=A0A2H0XUL9_UNCSA|nr:MAG: hypothetical protein COT42_07375 [Candidatus Saganbacteria bacterium CG08_land_8_20_14_0_20_45_16]